MTPGTMGKIVPIERHTVVFLKKDRPTLYLACIHSVADGVAMRLVARAYAESKACKAWACWMIGRAISISSALQIGRYTPPSYWAWTKNLR